MKNSAYRLDQDPAQQWSSLAEITHAASQKRQGWSGGTDETAGRANTELIEQVGDRSFQEAVSFLLRSQWEREAKQADCSEADEVEGALRLPPTQEPARSDAFRNQIKRTGHDLRTSQAKVRFALRLIILAELVVAAIFLGCVLSGGA
jgi:hypothetical protein